jgi:hypothetical protein
MAAGVVTVPSAIVPNAIVALASPAGWLDVVADMGEEPFARVANGELGVVRQHLDDNYASVSFESARCDVAVPLGWLRGTAGVQG